MTQSERAKRLGVDIELGEVRRVLGRVEAVVEREDYDLLAGIVETLIELNRLVQQKGATIARLRRMLGWSSSEKTSQVLGDDPEPGASEAALGPVDASGQEGSSELDASRTDNGAPPDEPKRKPKGHGRTPVSAYAGERIAVPHGSLHAGCQCPGCARGSLHPLKEPASYLRIIGQAPLVAQCWNCGRLRCGTCGQVFTAPPPQQARGPKYTESAASMMALLRYGMGLPLNRLAQLQAHLQVPVPSSTQWEIALERSSAVLPVYEELIKRAAGGALFHNDDTYMRVLEFMGKRRAKLLARGELPDPDRTGLFATAVVAITAPGPIAMFFTGRKHAGENLAQLLEARTDPNVPIQMCDGLDRNLPKQHEVIVSNCLAHGRRHIVDEAQDFPSECRHVLEKLGVVFHNEALCKKQGLAGTDRLRLHQQSSGPVMDELKAWMEAELEQKRVEPNSGLGDAFHYLLKRWDRLTLFLRVTGAPIDNNLCERVLKMAIRHRNNSKFYRSLRGARVGDIYMTLISTAMLHHQNPFEYLTALMTHESLVAKNPDDWLPWSFRATIERLEQVAARAA